jgi:5-methylcytosine-specific restriction endonuclease McrA
LIGNDGSYFYCSQECKDVCPLYNLQSDPFKNSKKPYTESEYQQFRYHVLQRDNHKCQYCGEKAEHVHHERPQKLEPFFALDPDYAWSVCKKCHYEKGHTNECSTGKLSSKICT